MDDEAEEEALVQRVNFIKKAHLVFVTGGDQSRLTEAYKGPILEALKARYAQGGLMYVGCSAGTHVLSKLMITGGSGNFAQKGQVQHSQGWGILDVTFDTHLDSRDRQYRCISIVSQYPNVLACGMF